MPLHTSNAIIHVDMDAFYASVEQQDNVMPAGQAIPSLLGRHKLSQINERGLCHVDTGPVSA